ncbi:hypothetical protein ACHAW5_006888 [Stephanodiscus triporus]|uniref:Coiled-coil alpha-helical rod protein 1 n=1 Tax=Stephanodiscus triporus TaxID=2934178 RepID=A0ABD3MUN0_9STRA
MDSLGDKLVHLSLEIEDRTKSVELLSQLINDQSSRHACEITNLENEQTASLEKFASESKEILAGISHTNHSLIERKNALENQRDDLLATHQQVEYTKKKNLDAVRRDIAEAKESAHQAFKQEKSQREKAWFDARVSDINKITWKGIEPNVQRLVRKHREQCEEIKANLQFSKQKLELQCENDLAERVQGYQRNEQQSNALANQRSNFVNMLVREQNEHALSLIKLKERLVLEEESAKNMFALQLDTLAKDYSVALSKITCSPNVQRLAQDLSAKKSARQQELEANLARIGKDIISAKALWEESWMKESAARVEKKKSKTMEVLIAWRSNEIDGLIRKSLLDQGTHESSDDHGVQLTASHATDVTALNESIRKQQIVNKEIKDKLAAIDNSKAALRSRVSKVEEDLRFAESKLKDITCDIDRKKLQHASIMDETSIRIEGSIQAIVRRRCEIEKEIKDATEKYRRELRRYPHVFISDHDKAKEKAMHEHEIKLGDLETHATKSADELREKLQRAQNSIKEQHAILVRSQALAARYREI